MKKHSSGHKLILIGNVLHGFIFAMLLLEYIGSALGVFYGLCLVLLVPNIICYRNAKQSTNNNWAFYFIVIGVLFTIGVVGVFYIIGGLLVSRHNNQLREQERIRRVNL